MMTNAERAALLDRLGGLTYQDIGKALGVSASDANRLALDAADKIGIALDDEPPRIGDRFRDRLVEELGRSTVALR